jgi:hypothetical protein
LGAFKECRDPDVTGADLNRLLRDRAYKEQHRPALTTFFQSQVQHRPRLPEEHFLKLVYGAADVDVLLITGMRDIVVVRIMVSIITALATPASTPRRFARFDANFKQCQRSIF